jgi:hypothetical protein
MQFKVTYWAKHPNPPNISLIVGPQTLADVRAQAMSRAATTQIRTEYIQIEADQGETLEVWVQQKGYWVKEAS